MWNNRRQTKGVIGESTIDRKEVQPVKTIKKKWITARYANS